MNTTIWVIQGLMAALFLMAGIMKTTQSKENLKARVGGWVDDFSDGTIKAIGALEIAGAIGLVLPMLLHQFEFLTPIAAAGLILTMIGASAVHIKRKENKDVYKNVVITALLIAVLIGRIGLII